MKMRIIASLVVTVGLLFLTSCPTPFSPPDPEVPVEKKLSEKVVDELVMTLSGNGATARTLGVGGSRTVDAACLETIKTKALQSIQSDGFADSANLDQILPSMLKGVQNALMGIEELQAQPEQLKQILSLASKSATGSMAVPDRAAMFSEGTKADAAVGAVMETAVRAMIAVVRDPVVLEQAITETIRSVAAELESSQSNALGAAEVTSALYQMSRKALEVVVNSPAINVDSESLVSAITSTVIKVASDNDKVSEKTAVIANIVEASVATVVAHAGSNQKEDLVKNTIAGASQSISSLTGDAKPDDQAIAAAVGKAVTGTSIVVDTQAILNETAPGISNVKASSANISVEGGESILSATVSRGSIVWRWEQVSGPAGFSSAESVARAENGDVEWTFKPTIPGNYAFRLLVRNADGFKKSVGEIVSIQVTFVSNAEKTAINQAMAAMKNRQWTQALYHINRAYAINPENYDILLWKAMIELASISADPQIVALMKDRIGLVDYPSDMDSIFSSTWFNQTFYYTSPQMVPLSAVGSAPDDVTIYVRGDFFPFDDYDPAGRWLQYETVTADGSMDNKARNGRFVANPAGSAYHRIGSYIFGFLSRGDVNYENDPETGEPVEKHGYWDGTEWVDPLEVGDSLCYRHWNFIDRARPQLFPALQTPDWAKKFLEGKSGQSGGTLEEMVVYDYPFLLLCNLIDRNPLGINAAVDQVLAGAFGERFESALRTFAAIPADASITIPNDLVKAYAGVYGAAMPDDMVITIHKFHLEAVVAELEFNRSFALLLGSYNMNYPVSDIKGLMNATGDVDPTKYMKNPVKTGFMQSRDTARRASAKQAMLRGLGHAGTAMDALESFDLANYLTALKVGNGASDAAALAKSYAKAMLRGVRALEGSLKDGKTFYVKLGDLMAHSPDSPAAWLAEGYTWPGEAGTGLVQVKPAALFDVDILDPAKLFEKSAAGGLNVYGVKVVPADKTEPSRSPVLNADDSTLQATLISPENIASIVCDASVVKVSASRLAKLIPDLAAVGLPTKDFYLKGLGAYYSDEMTFDEFYNSIFSANDDVLSAKERSFLKWVRGE